MVTADDEDVPSYPSTPTMLRKTSRSSDGSFPTNDSTPDKDDSHNLLMPEAMLRLQDRFAKKQKKGTIDVWWLFDDGGQFGGKIIQKVNYHISPVK